MSETEDVARVRAELLALRDLLAWKQWQLDLSEDAAEEACIRGPEDVNIRTFAGRLQAAARTQSLDLSQDSHMGPFVQSSQPVQIPVGEELPLDAPNSSLCTVFRPSGDTAAEATYKSLPTETVCVARFEKLPSFDHTTPLSRPRATSGATFDHHPLRNYRKEPGWDKTEREALRVFWDGIHEEDVDGLDERSAMEPLIRNPWADRLNFAIAQAWLEQFGMPPELLEKLSGYFEIPDDETMLEWLLLHFDCNDPHRKRWTDALTSAIEYLSDLFENRPLVEVLDDYRATKTEGSGRQRFDLRFATGKDAWHSLCPLHLLYHCPYHEPLLAQRFIGEDVKDDEWRPVCSTRSRHHASKLYLPPPHDKKTRDTGCGPNCWRAERAIDISERTLSDILDTWTPENAQGFGVIAGNADVLSPCDVIRMLPGTFCYEVEHAIRLYVALKDKEERAQAQQVKVEKKSSSKRKSLDIKEGLRVLKYRGPSDRGAHSYKKGVGANHSDDQDLAYNKRLPNQTFGYSPCHHPGVSCEEAGEDCNCHTNFSFCDKFCDCAADCERRFKGCYYTCHSADGLYQPEKCYGVQAADTCPCYRQGRECDPDLCSAQGPRCLGNCDNMNIQLRKGKKCFVARSGVEGFGLFLGEPCGANQLLQEYTGELISQGEGNRRAIAFKTRQKTYFYELGEALIQGLHTNDKSFEDRVKGIDSEYFGNRTRYINAPPSGLGELKKTKPNCAAKVAYVLGEHRIGIYSDRPMEVGTEITMEYGPLYHFATPA